MKRIISAILILTLALTLFGCGKKKTAEAPKLNEDLVQIGESVTMYIEQSSANLNVAKSEIQKASDIIEDIEQTLDFAKFAEIDTIFSTVNDYLLQDKFNVESAKAVLDGVSSLNSTYEQLKEIESTYNLTIAVSVSKADFSTLSYEQCLNKLNEYNMAVISIMGGISTVINRYPNILAEMNAAIGY